MALGVHSKGSDLAVKGELGRFSSSGEQGWRIGESTRLPPMWPGFKSRRRRPTWVEFVVGSLPCSERFFPGSPVFPSPQKSTTLPNSN